MQTRAIMKAACAVTKRGGSVHPEIMIPLVGFEAELEIVRGIVEENVKAVAAEQGVEAPAELGFLGGGHRGLPVQAALDSVLPAPRSRRSTSPASPR